MYFINMLFAILNAAGCAWSIGLGVSSLKEGHPFRFGINITVALWFLITLLVIRLDMCLI